MMWLMPGRKKYRDFWRLRLEWTGCVWWGRKHSCWSIHYNTEWGWIA